MTTQRAVVKGDLASAVQVRNVFTCDVVESGGDTAPVLWEAYLNSIYNELMPIMRSILHITSFEMYDLVAGEWVPAGEIEFTYEGAVQSGDFLPNAVAIVLLGKAAGARHVGRKFFSGLPESTAFENGLAVGVASTVAAVLAAYITPFTGIGGGVITPGVVTSSGTFHAFLGGSVSSFLGSIRRRKPSVGI